MKSKDKILYTASRLFHLQGYNSTGINQIIDEAGVAKSTLYQYYRSKEQLAVDYLEVRHRHWFDQLNEYIASGKTNSEKIMLCFEFITYMNKKEDYKGCCFLNILPEIRPEAEPIKTTILKHKNQLLNLFKEFTAGNSSNDITYQPIYLLFEGALMESKLYREDWVVDVAKMAAINLIT